MTQQLYDSIGERYERTKYIPTGQVERATLLAAFAGVDGVGTARNGLPDLTGRTMLDVGTGTGFYPRMFADLGAGSVLGVDESSEMIGIAESLSQPALRYQVRDAANLPVLGAFDLVTTVWLVGHAQDDAELSEMFAGMAANLTDRGTLIVVGPNPDVDWTTMAGDYGRYGYVMQPQPPVGRRTGYTVTLTDGGPDLSFPSGSWNSGAITDALAKAGLEQIVRQPTTLPGGIGHLPHPHDQDIPAEPGFWHDMLRSPAMVVYRASRS